MTLKENIKFSKKLHPLCDSLSYRNAYHQEKLGLLKDIAIYRKGYIAVVTSLMKDLLIKCSKKLSMQ